MACASDTLQSKGLLQDMCYESATKLLTIYLLCHAQVRQRTLDSQTQDLDHPCRTDDEDNLLDEDGRGKSVNDSY